MQFLQAHAPELDKATVITVANKQDEEGAMDIQDIGQTWVQDPLWKDVLQAHAWRIFPCQARSGSGCNRIVEYLYKTYRDSCRTSDGSRASSDSVHHRELYFDRNNMFAAGQPMGVPFLSPRPQLDRAMSTARMLPVTPWEDLRNPHHMSDDEFYGWFLQRKPLLFLDQYSMLRILYLAVRTSPPEKRSETTREVLYSAQAVLRDIELLEQDTLRETVVTNGNRIKRPVTRIEDELLHGSIQYAETHILFWLQMVSFSVLKHPVLEGEDTSFEAFLSNSPELWDGEAWRQYYTAKVYQSERAIHEFLPPDRKPLPNAFKPSSFALEGSGLKIHYQVL